MSLGATTVIINIMMEVTVWGLRYHEHHCWLFILSLLDLTLPKSAMESRAEWMGRSLSLTEGRGGAQRHLPWLMHTSASPWRRRDLNVSSTLQPDYVTFSPKCLVLSQFQISAQSVLPTANASSPKSTGVCQSSKRLQLLLHPQNTSSSCQVNQCIHSLVHFANVCKTFTCPPG